MGIRLVGAGSWTRRMFHTPVGGRVASLGACSALVACPCMAPACRSTTPRRPHVPFTPRTLHPTCLPSGVPGDGVGGRHEDAAGEAGGGDGGAGRAGWGRGARSTACVQTSLPSPSGGGHVEPQLDAALGGAAGDGSLPRCAPGCRRGGGGEGEGGAGAGERTAAGCLAGGSARWVHEALWHVACRALQGAQCISAGHARIQLAPKGLP